MKLTAFQQHLFAAFAFLATAGFICFAVWSAGFDFDHRGVDAFFVVIICAVFASYMAAGVYVFTERKKSGGLKPGGD